ncbi:hypothetical protein H4R35_004516 [Dimargaris xerosporica]|nr:hypothetical protein H4R35_004516 [Dimargaris xerosporica]
MPAKVLVDQLIANLTVGAGAVQLPKQVRSVALQYQARSRVYGLRHFLKQHLPRLQYNNPSVHFKLDQRKEPMIPQLSIDFADNTNKIINVQGLNSATIFEKLMTQVRQSTGGH